MFHETCPHETCLLALKHIQLSFLLFLILPPLLSHLLYVPRFFGYTENPRNFVSKRDIHGQEKIEINGRKFEPALLMECKPCGDGMKLLEFSQVVGDLNSSPINKPHARCDKHLKRVRAQMVDEKKMIVIEKRKATWQVSFSLSAALQSATLSGPYYQSYHYDLIVRLLFRSD